MNLYFTFHFDNFVHFFFKRDFTFFTFFQCFFDVFLSGVVLSM